MFASERSCRRRGPDKSDLSSGPFCKHIPHGVGKLTGRKKGAIDESADAAAGVDVLIPSPRARLITPPPLPGLSLGNCIQDHRVSL